MRNCYGGTHPLAPSSAHPLGACRVETVPVLRRRFGGSRFASFLHLLLVLFPRVHSRQPFPRSFTSRGSKNLERTGGRVTGLSQRARARASKPRIYDDRRNVRPRRTHLAVYRAHSTHSRFFHGQARNFYSPPSDCGGGVAPVRRAYLHLTRVELRRYCPARQRDFPVALRRDGVSSLIVASRPK